MQLEVKIRGLMVDPSTGTPIVILKDVNSDMLLPIWVGSFEANSIALEIEKNASQRPMTHDLIRNILVGTNHYVRRVVINELRDNTFYAAIEVMDAEGRPGWICARPPHPPPPGPALRSDCPIFVEEQVIDASRNSIVQKSESNQTEEVEEWPDVIGEAGDLPM